MEHERIIVEQKCKCCNEPYAIDVPKEVCPSCFTKKMIQFFKEEQAKKPKSNFLAATKQFAYHVIFDFIPLWIIGLKYGFDVQLIVIGYAFWSMYFLRRIINFCMRIF